ncbi:MAG: DUF1553 domain-containing protein, partial [Pirellulaceae bacterium]
AFDFADPSVVTGQRNVSTVAPQALFLMNHPFVLAQSQAAAERLLRDLPQASDGERLAEAFQRTLGRAPRPAEATAAAEFLTDSQGSWASLFQALFASVDFRYAR